MAGSEFKRVRLGGLATLCATRQQLAAQMVADARANQSRDQLPKLVFSSNGQGLALANRNPAYGALMQQADYIHADGQSVVLASRWLTRTPLPERIATTDFFYDAALAASAAGLRFYFLGGPEEHNQQVVEAVRQLYPQLIICGRHHDRFSPAQEPAIIADILACQTDILWISMGKPQQEEFCVRNQQALRGVSWLKPCGGLFKFLIGIDPRAPRLMQQMGLEWLYRMSREPRRLFWRYFISNFQAAWFLLTRTG